MMAVLWLLESSVDKPAYRDLTTKRSLPFSPGGEG
jgi:hypothetical protein